MCGVMTRLLNRFCPVAPYVWSYDSPVESCLSSGSIFVLRYISSYIVQRKTNLLVMTLSPVYLTAVSINNVIV